MWLYIGKIDLVIVVAKDGVVYPGEERASCDFTDTHAHIHMHTRVQTC